MLWWSVEYICVVCGISLRSYIAPLWESYGRVVIVVHARWVNSMLTILKFMFKGNARIEKSLLKYGIYIIIALLLAFNTYNIKYYTAIIKWRNWKSNQIIHHLYLVWHIKPTRAARYYTLRFLSIIRILWEFYFFYFTILSSQHRANRLAVLWF